MGITAADIENQNFAISKKGYDVDEVDVFLEHVAHEIDLLNQEIKNLKNNNSETNLEETATATTVDSADLGEDATKIIAEKDKQIKDLESKLENKTKEDSAISQALIVAQRSADEIIANANVKAETTIADAHDEADRIINRAESEKESIMAAISKLEEDKEETRNGFATMLRDFIEESNTKLNNLGFDDDVDAIPYDETDSNETQLPLDLDALTNDDSTKQKPAHSTFIEKDLSGFGDVIDDDEDID